MSMSNGEIVIKAETIVTYERVPHTGDSIRRETREYYVAIPDHPLWKFNSFVKARDFATVCSAEYGLPVLDKT